MATRDEFTHEHLHDAIEALGERLQAQLGDVRDHVARLDESIRGNGRPGLTQRVALIEQRNAFLAAGFLAGLPVAWDFIKRQLGWP